MATQWSFGAYTFPIADSPPRPSGDWNLEEKLIEQDPLMANATILTTWGQKSARRTISGTCGQTTRDQMRTFHANGTVGTRTDAEGRQVSCRIISANFSSIIPIDRYEYNIEFIAR